MIKAVIFDLDGVILDTERLNLKFKIEKAISLGYNLTRDELLPSLGLGKKEAEAFYYQLVGNNELYPILRAYRREKTLQLFKTQGPSFKPGIKDVFTYLRQNGFKIAMATSSELSLVEKYFFECDFLDCFDAIVTNDMVTNGKHHPDIYQKAISLLKINPKEIIAVEDSYNGILAATNANLRVIFAKDMITLNEKQLDKVSGNFKVITELIEFIEKENNK